MTISTAGLVVVWGITGAAAGLVIGFVAHRREPPWPDWVIPVQILATAVLFGLLAARTGPTPVLLPPSWAAATGITLAILDLRTRRLPDWLTLPSYLAIPGLAALATALVAADPAVLGRGLLGMGMILSLYGVVAVSRPGAMGGGDWKLSGSLAFVLAWQGISALLAATLLTWLLAALSLLARALVGRLSRNQQYPAGHYMIGASLAVILLSPWDPALLP